MAEEVSKEIPPERVLKAREQIVNLCRNAYQDGYNKGYADGLEAGMRTSKPMAKVTLA